ncbi:NAD-dependent epimerase/dehydratase family protein [Actinokineospora pegani]|uniref:NAD-dependent epimerase/dehydratase family protein n=1 Tax=Actinokineospora pegani TaxID=2654637 RepID=UPI0012EA503B|nr:NAD-dependent epimerase/dehydratase family protein [Actinokineospora pegani]
MRVLVLGGTRFVGRAVAAEAVARGHEVLCAARGLAGPVPDGARLVVVDRDAVDGLAPLAGLGRFDAVVDLAPISYDWVSRALAALADRTAHWTFVSSISVYADPAATPAGVADPLLPPRAEHGSRDLLATDPDRYGSIKVASENAVRRAAGEDRSLVVRAGLITGPGDEHDRFGYWPARMSRGGRVVVPDSDQPSQFVDVRDLARWIVDAGERGLTGTHDGIGPATPLRDLLAAISEAVSADVDLVPVAPRRLTELGVAAWSGPRSLPLWLPDSHRNMTNRDPAPAAAAGLVSRPLAEVVAGALDHERALGLDRERKAGLTPDQEREVLAALDS